MDPDEKRLIEIRLDTFLRLRDLLHESLPHLKALALQGDCDAESLAGKIRNALGF